MPSRAQQGHDQTFCCIIQTILLRIEITDVADHYEGVGMLWNQYLLEPDKGTIIPLLHRRDSLVDIEITEAVDS
jgi:hypothetical protein